MYSTKNFNVATDPKLACTCGNVGCDKRMVNPEEMDMLQLVRDWLGTPMILSSGGRCPLHPDEVHRDKPADHQKCRGIDVKYKTVVERNLIVMYGVQAGFNAIAYGKGFVHLGHRPELPKGKLVTWTYD